MADREKLAAALTALQAELAAADEVDPELAEKLQTALAHLQTRLEAEARHVEPHDKDETPADQLRHAMEEFEGSHPTLSGMIGSVIDTLSRMGI